MAALVACLSAAGCATKARPYTAREAVEALEQKASQIQTVRGRAWINARTPEQKISFPAVIVVDRTQPEQPLLRIEAMDPLGATHVLMILDRKGKLTSVDYDNRRVYEARGSWYGLPLSRLPELLLGFTRLPEEGRVASADVDGFEVRTGPNRFKFLMTWIDPGPRLALGGIDAEVTTSQGQADRYVVRYSHYLDKDDFYLPRDVKLHGYVKNAPEPQIDLNIAWRERRWNERIPEQVFRLPELRGFTRD